MYGSDAANSMEPDEFRRMAQGLSEIVDATLAHPVDKDNVLSKYSENEAHLREEHRHRACTGRGTNALTRQDLAFKKPGDGIPAARWRELIGRRLRRAAPADRKLSFDDLN